MKTNTFIGIHKYQELKGGAKVFVPLHCYVELDHTDTRIERWCNWEQYNKTNAPKRRKREWLCYDR